MRAAVIFEDFGPYHIARLSAAASTCDLLGVEVLERSLEYPWNPTKGYLGFARRTLVCQAASEKDACRILKSELQSTLADFQPDVVAVPGWSSTAAFAAVRWCIERRVPCVVMSESQFGDYPRSIWKELLKRSYITMFQSALVGGEPHREYLTRLGMPPNNIFLGYDAVDNIHFTRGALAAKAHATALRRRLSLPNSYFIMVNRLHERKNLVLAFRAFARYREASTSPPWDLLVVGDGPFRPDLDAVIEALGLQRHVHLVGSKQYDELPAYYGLAGALVHAASSEQWGLVVNEAMASCLPVIVSHRCGCVHNLVTHAANGLRFDPANEEELARCLLAVSGDVKMAERMGKASLKCIEDWGLNRFREGFFAAISCATHTGPIRSRWVESFLLPVLSLK